MAGMPKRSLATLVALALLVAPTGAHAAVGDVVAIDTGTRNNSRLTDVEDRPAISADGRLIAYVAPRELGSPMLYLRDLRQPEPVAVVTPSNDDWPYLASNSPVLSDSGRYLAFVSDDPALSAEDADLGNGPGGSAQGGSQIRDVFLYDRRTQRLKLVSRRSGSHGQHADNDSGLPSISADGRYVAYGSPESSNLPTNDRLTIGGVFSRDLQTEQNRMVSGVPGIMFWRPGSYAPEISADGRRVVYVFQYSPKPWDPEHPPADIRRWLHRRHQQIMLDDPRWREPRVVSRANGRRGALAQQNCTEASASANGRFIAFTTKAANLTGGDGNRAEDVYVRDVRLGVTTLVSRAGRGGAVGDGDSGLPSISADGRLVAFQSEAANLSPGDGDPDPDVYVKDLRSGRLTLLSRGIGGQPSDGRSSAPVITPDGRFVVFASNASNISPEVDRRRLAYYRVQLLP